MEGLETYRARQYNFSIHETTRKMFKLVPTKIRDKSQAKTLIFWAVEHSLETLN